MRSFANLLRQSLNHSITQSRRVLLLVQRLVIMFQHVARRPGLLLAGGSGQSLSKLWNPGT